LVLRVPDLKPLARLAPGLNIVNLWISGNGHTIYAILAGSKGVVVMAEDGTHQLPIPLEVQLTAFDAMEHG
jgi:hypothetical protein